MTVESSLVYVVKLGWEREDVGEREGRVARGVGGGGSFGAFQEP